MAIDPIHEGPTRLERLEAELVASTRAQEVMAIAGRAPSPKAAIPRIMRAFSLSLPQAVIVMDAPFSVVTLSARRRIEEELAVLRSMNG